MRWIRWRLGLALLACATGCGGRVVDDGSRDGNVSSSGGGSAESPSGRGAVDLPPCKPGFEARDQPSRACTWIDLDGLCYETKLEACACACRASGGDICSSPLLDAPESRIPVDCF